MARSQQFLNKLMNYKVSPFLQQIKKNPFDPSTDKAELQTTHQ